MRYAITIEDLSRAILGFDQENAAALAQKLANRTGITRYVYPEAALIAGEARDVVPAIYHPEAA